MILDYNAANGAYVLRVPRAEADTIVLNHGLDFSETASTPEEAVLFTRDPYAACAFDMHATVKARGALGCKLERIAMSWAQDTGAHIKVPGDKTLWPFQKAGVEYALASGNTLIGDQPGLGKTAQAIALANEMQARRVLVVCPANIRLQWAKAIREWSTLAGRFVIYPILKSADGVHPSAAWTTVSYDLCRSPSILAALAVGTYDLIVFDEAHMLKSAHAKRTEAVLEKLAPRAGKLLALTGTPLPNRPRECYTITRALDWSAIDWSSERAFQARYNPQARFGPEVTGRLPELQARLRANFMVRRLRRDVMKQLPPVMHEIVHLAETGEIRKALEAERMLDIDPETLAGANAQILGHISVVRRMMGVAMAPQVADYVDMMLDEGVPKIFVSAHHHEVLDILEKKLHIYGVLRVDGRTSPTQRQLKVDRFQSDPSQRIFLGQITAVGTGTDGLQRACSRVILAEVSWVPGENEQIVGRLDRGGQTEPILASMCAVPGSFAERVISTSLRKMQNIHTTLDKEHY